MKSLSGHSLEMPSLSEGLRVIKECPLCQTHYNEKEMSILEERTGGKLVHMHCKRCKHNILAVILVTPIGMSSVGMVTELSPEEAARFQTHEPISEDMVLDFHTMLHTREQTFITAILS